MTFKNPTFRDITPGGAMPDTSLTAPSTETKAGTIVTFDSNDDKLIKVVDFKVTAAASLTDYPMVLLQDVRDFSAQIYDYRSFVEDVAEVSKPCKVAFRPGHIFVLGPQVSADEQAGWTGDIDAGDILYTSLDDTGTANGGICDDASKDVDGTDYYAQPVGIARNSVTAAEGGLLEWVYVPQVLGA